MATSWKTKINGKTYTAKMVNGAVEYDPPMPADQLAREKQNMAGMAEARRAPGCVTDSTFFAGVGTLSEQFRGEERQLSQMVANAKANGYTPANGDFYQEGLADYPGDPKAFVKSRGEVRERCLERGVPCHGSVNVSEHEVAARPERVKKTKLADDIVNRKVMDIKKAGGHVKSESAIRQEIVEKHGSK
jgi:hypothetical protein